MPCLLNLSTLGLVPCILAKGSRVEPRRKALHSATAALSRFAQLLLWGALKRRTNWIFSLWDRLYVAHTGFKLMILLLQPSGCCNYCHVPPYLTLLCGVCVCVCLSPYALVGVHVWQGQKSTSSVLLGHSPPYALRQFFGGTGTGSFDWSESPRDLLASPPSTGAIVHTTALRTYIDAWVKFGSYIYFRIYFSFKCIGVFACL